LNIARTAHNSQLNSSILQDGINLQKKSKNRKGSGGNFSNFDDRQVTYHHDSASRTSNNLGSLILNSPIEKPDRMRMKLRTGIVSQTKTNPSIPYK
jgi:hypothetical protein